MEVFDTQDKGRGTRALKCFKIGQLVLKSSANHFVLSNAVRGHMCDFCFFPSANLSRCSVCKFARYCGRDCQTKAWKSHKNECKRTAKCCPHLPTDMVRLIARILDVKHGVCELEESNDIHSMFERLVSNKEKMSDSRKKGFVDVIAALKLFLGEDEIQNSSELFDIFGKISCNSFTISDGEMQPIGEILKQNNFINK